MKKQIWWKEFFSDFRPVFDTIPARTTNADVRYIIRKLNLKAGSEFLDCPCGIGRISLPLAQKGVCVTGVDVTREYLEELSHTAIQKKLKITLKHADMRKITYRNRFDAAINFGTSFGYFKKESDDLLTLKKAYQSLKPGGIFLLNTVNRDWILKYFDSREWQKLDDILILLYRTFDYSSSRMVAKWSFIQDKDEKRYTTDLRMYSLHELLPMMKSAGFTEIEAFGSTKDDPVSVDSRLMYIFGKKGR
ncbi:MAG: methyltransferase domain-containing protein [candidate division Zixibacteria bacterium]|nr:methyltransferase domain-containing protein [candidate division Zixibacteria bacterium]